MSPTTRAAHHAPRGQRHKASAGGRARTTFWERTILVVALQQANSISGRGLRSLAKAASIKVVYEVGAGKGCVLRRPEAKGRRLEAAIQASRRLWLSACTGQYPAVRSNALAMSREGGLCNAPYNARPREGRPGAVAPAGTEAPGCISGSAGLARTSTRHRPSTKASQ